MEDHLIIRCITIVPVLEPSLLPKMHLHRARAELSIDHQHGSGVIGTSSVVPTPSRDNDNPFSLLTEKRCAGGGVLFPEMVEIGFGHEKEGWCTEGAFN
jgi:hypothetical protein